MKEHTDTRVSSFRIQCCGQTFYFWSEFRRHVEGEIYMRSDDCDVSDGDTQCPYILPRDEGYLCCRYILGHEGRHRTSYEIDFSDPEDWIPRKEDVQK